MTGTTTEPSTSNGGSSRDTVKKVLIAALVLLTVTQIVTIYLLITRPSPDNAVELPATAAHSEDGEGHQAGDDEELQEGERPLGATFPFEPMTTNLADTGYLRVQLVVEFIEREQPRKFHARLPLIRDGILALIATKPRAQLLTSKGRDDLREEIKALIHSALHQDVIERVFMTQFLIH